MRCKRSKHNTFISSFIVSQEFVGRDLKDPRFDLLVSAETNAGYSFELHSAASQGNLAEVKRLISLGHNPMCKDDDNDSALHVAAYEGRLKILKYLIEEEGCNPSVTNFDGATLLHIVAQAKYLSIVEYLVDEVQMDPLEQDENGYSPLHKACVSGD